MTAAKMDPMLMSRIITPTPAKNSDGHERHEQGGVAHGEQHAQGADRERLGNQMAAVRKPISAASACSARMPVYGIA